MLPFCPILPILLSPSLYAISPLLTLSSPSLPPPLPFLFLFLSPSSLPLPSSPSQDRLLWCLRGSVHAGERGRKEGGLEGAVKGGGESWEGRVNPGKHNLSSYSTAPDVCKQLRFTSSYTIHFYLLVFLGSFYCYVPVVVVFFHLPIFFSFFGRRFRNCSFSLFPSLCS